MEIKKFAKNFSLLKSSVKRPLGIEHDFKIKKVIYTLGLLVLIFLFLYLTASLITNYTGFGVSDLIR